MPTSILQRLFTSNMTCKRRLISLAASLGQVWWDIRAKSLITVTKNILNFDMFIKTYYSLKKHLMEAKVVLLQYSGAVCHPICIKVYCPGLNTSLGHVRTICSFFVDLSDLCFVDVTFSRHKLTPNFPKCSPLLYLRLTCLFFIETARVNNYNLPVLGEWKRTTNGSLAKASGWSGCSSTYWYQSTTFTESDLPSKESHSYNSRWRQL